MCRQSVWALLAVAVDTRTKAPREDYELSGIVRRAAGQFAVDEPLPSDAEGKWRVSLIIPGKECYVTVRRPGSTSWQELTDFTALPGESVDLGTLTLAE